MDEYNKLYHVLNIDVSNAIRKDFSFDKFLAESKFAGKPAGVWFILNNLGDYFDPDWLTYMESLDLQLGSCLIFYREPHYIHPEAHIDIFEETKKPAIYALNFVVDPDDDSEMVWYDVPPESGQYARTIADTPYVFWPMSEVENKVLDKCNIKRQLTLVSVGQAHNIIVRNKARWSFSIRFRRNSKSITNWKEAVDYFKPFMKN